MGDDIFDYNAISESPVGALNRDVITDFQADADMDPDSDLIDVSGIDADVSTADDDAFTWGGMNASVVANNITWYQSGGDTFVQGDVNGDTTADFEIELTGLKSLADTDFVL